MVDVIRLGLRDYEEVLQIQEQHFSENIAHKLSGRPTRSVIISCSHPPVFTLGKNANEQNVTGNWKSAGAKLIRTNRGGDVTFHGPGQLVLYPVFDLERFGIGIARYIWLLEEAVIRSLAFHGIVASRITTAQGVWLDAANPVKVRKICAVGVKVSRSVTMHGLAVNLNTDLRYFDLIVPCGLANMGVTSLQKELGHSIDEAVFENMLLHHLLQLLTTHSVSSSN